MIVRFKQGSVAGNGEIELAQGPVFMDVESVTTDLKTGYVSSMVFKDTVSLKALQGYKVNRIHDRIKRVSRAGGYVLGDFIYGEVEVVEEAIHNKLLHQKTLSDYLTVLHGTADTDLPGQYANRLALYWVLSRGLRFMRGLSLDTIAELETNFIELGKQLKDGVENTGDLSLHLKYVKDTELLVPLLGRLQGYFLTNIHPDEPLHETLKQIDGLFYRARLTKNQRLTASDLLDIPYRNLSPGVTTLGDVLEPYLNKPVSMIFELALTIWLLP